MKVRKYKLHHHGTSMMFAHGMALPEKYPKNGIRLKGVAPMVVSVTRIQPDGFIAFWDATKKRLRLFECVNQSTPTEFQTGRSLFDVTIDLFVC